MASIQYPHDRGRAGEKGELSNAASIERVSPCTVSIGHMSRRGFLALPLLCSSALAFPGIAQADSVDADSITYYARPDLTIEEFEAFVQQQTEAEAAKVIEDAMLQTQTESILPRGGRPTYSTVYGTKTIKTTGVKDAGGQPSGGYGYTNPGGGSLFLTNSGGGSVSVSASLPGGLGSIGVSLSVGSRTSSVTGWTVNIPGDGRHYKATCKCDYYVQPYVVYETVYGVKRVYRKMASKTFYRMTCGIRRV